MFKRMSVSISKKKDLPTTDSQVKKVYEMDAFIEKILSKKTDKNDNSEYLLTARKYFSDEGFVDFEILKNGRKRISQVNVEKQILSFCDTTVSLKCHETIIHELAHAVTRFKYGYFNNHDSHGEAFISAFFILLKKLFNFSIKELEGIADQFGVKYFSNFILEEKIVSNSVFNKELDFYKNNDNFIIQKEVISKHKSFSNILVVDKEKEIAISFFSNNNNFYSITKRGLIEWEKDMLMNKFEKIYYKKLNNFFLISPIFKVHRCGTISKHGKYYTFIHQDVNKIKNDLNKGTIFFQNKTKAVESRKNLIKNKKTIGYNIQSYKSLEQFYSVFENFNKTILNKD